MRLLIVGLSVMLGFGLVLFLFSNPYTTSVKLGNNEYHDVEVFWVVFVSVLVGIVFTTILALAEGGQTRLDNRRLRKEMRRLETELNYLRTQPPTASRGEESSETALERPAAPRAPRTVAAPPSAPVYGAEGDEAVDPDDDMYTGGRAV